MTSEKAAAVRQALKGEKYISLETFKKDGTGVKTPVWFVEVADHFAVFTDGKSYKVKRVRRDPKSRIAACDMRGNVHGGWFETTTRVSEDAALNAQVHAALTEKYGLLYRLTGVGARLSGSIKRRTILIIDPI